MWIVAGLSAHVNHVNAAVGCRRTASACTMRHFLVSRACTEENGCGSGLDVHVASAGMEARSKCWFLDLLSR